MINNNKPIQPKQNQTQQPKSGKDLLSGVMGQRHKKHEQLRAGEEVGSGAALKNPGIKKKDVLSKHESAGVGRLLIGNKANHNSNQKQPTKKTIQATKRANEEVDSGRPLGNTVKPFDIKRKEEERGSGKFL